MKMRYIGAALVLAVFFSFSTPVAAQVRYKDDEGVTHFVDSINDVPPKYRAGALGTQKSPAKTPSYNPSDPNYWNQKAKEADDR
jgi:hypothetical protein